MFPDMKRFSKCTLVLVVFTGVVMAMDYLDVRRKEKLLSNAVSQIGRRSGSIPFWPLGTEYRIILKTIPSPVQLDELEIANPMRGWVAVACEGCELSVKDADSRRNKLQRCHLFVVDDGKKSQLGDPATKQTNDLLQPRGEVNRFEIEDQSSPPRGKVTRVGERVRLRALLSSDNGKMTLQLDYQNASIDELAPNTKPSDLKVYSASTNLEIAARKRLAIPIEKAHGSSC